MTTNEINNEVQSKLKENKEEIWHNKREFKKLMGNKLTRTQN